MFDENLEEVTLETGLLDWEYHFGYDFAFFR